MNNDPGIFTLNERIDEIESVQEHEIIDRYIKISNILREIFVHKHRKLFGIEGNIGTGKSTLAALLQGDLSATAFIENVDCNLAWKRTIQIFYKDKIKHGFRTQLSLLSFRLDQAISAFEYPGSAVIDRTYWADQHVFVPALVQGGLPQRESRILDREYAKVCDLFPNIDLMFLLTCSPETSQQRIKQRFRGMEISIDYNYLVSIGKLYHSLPGTLHDRGLYRGPWIEIDQERFKVISRAHMTALLECIADCLDIKH